MPFYIFAPIILFDNYIEIYFIRNVDPVKLKHFFYLQIYFHLLKFKFYLFIIKLHCKNSSSSIVFFSHYLMNLVLNQFL